jgi:hypothetical protein
MLTQIEHNDDCIPSMRLFSGQLVVVIRSGCTPGTVRLKVTDLQRRLSQSVNILTK